MVFERVVVKTVDEVPKSPIRPSLIRGHHFHNSCPLPIGPGPCAQHSASQE